MFASCRIRITLVDHLRPLSGLDQPSSIIWGSTPKQMNISIDSVSFFVTQSFYIREGKQRLNIGIGCTGDVIAVLCPQRIVEHLKEPVSTPSRYIVICIEM